jgi:thioredoxin 1
MKNLTAENFEQVVSSERGLFVIQFYSDTCMPCKTMEPVIEALNEKNPSVNVYRVNTMADPELAQHFGVMGVPNIVFCEDREVLYRFTGVTPLADMQYVIENKDDPHFRQTGEFKTAEKKPDLIFAGVIVGLILIFLTLFFIK